MDKVKFEAGFKALAIAVGYSFENKEDRVAALRIYYSTLESNGFTDEEWHKCVERMITTFKPQYGVKFPPVKDFLDMSGLSVLSISEKAHRYVKNKIMTVGGYMPISFGKEHRHFVAMESIRRMGGWFAICQKGVQEWDNNKSRFVKIYEELFYDMEVPQKPLLGASDKKNQEFLAEYNGNQIENN